jgi:hypothetical protein
VSDDPNDASGGLDDARDADLENRPDGGDGADALRRLFAADGPSDFEDEEQFQAPVFWPEVSAADIGDTFAALRRWVELLVERFEHIDHRVIPPCWWRHPGHVEALQALRDHERGSFADSAPPQAASAWQRELQFTEARLRDWTAYYGCDQTNHKVPNRPPRLVDEHGWDLMIEADQLRRREREVAEPGREDLDEP